MICLFQTRKHLSEPHFLQTQGLLVLIIPMRLGGSFGSLLPKLVHTEQSSSLIYFTQFCMFKPQPTELREGRAGYRCDRAAGTLSDLKDALEFEDFP